MLRSTAAAMGRKLKRVSGQCDLQLLVCNSPAQSASFAADVGEGWQCCAIRDQDAGPEEAAAAPVHFQVRHPDDLQVVFFCKHQHCMKSAASIVQSSQGTLILVMTDASSHWLSTLAAGGSVS